MTTTDRRRSDGSTFTPMIASDFRAPRAAKGIEDAATTLDRLTAEGRINGWHPVSARVKRTYGFDYVLALHGCSQRMTAAQVAEFARNVADDPVDHEPTRRNHRMYTGHIRSIEQVEHHRNGISGEGFYAILFTATNADMGRCLATVFSNREGDGDWGVYERGEWDNPRVAVISLDVLPEHGVKFGANSWHGDHFAPELYTAIREEGARDVALGVAVESMPSVDQEDIDSKEV